MKKGKFIVIEGGDGIGKMTQTKLLEKRLKEKGYKILIGDFPRYYTSEWGKLVGRFLAGDFGKINEIDPRLATLPYMIDEYTWSRDEARPWLEKKGFILSNRYFTSNVHQIAKLKTRAKSQYREWLWRMGYEELGILKPDLILFLDVPPEIGRRLNKKKEMRKYLNGRKADIHERSGNHQLDAYGEYQRHVRLYKEWVKINCVRRRKLLSIEEIHEKIWKVVKSRL